MPLPIRSLPVIQNWDCHGCGDCCRTYRVPLSAAEQARIEAQGWNLPMAAFHRENDGSFSLAHHDGACVFLGEGNRCQIHAKWGEAAKPLACRVYPFVLVPTGDQWKVGIKFACPSAAANVGSSLSGHRSELVDYAAALEPTAAGATWPPAPPPLQPGQAVPWSDLARFVEAFLKILSTTEPLEYRLRHILALANQCRELRFDKVMGPKLGELLGILTEVTAEELRPAEQMPPPGWTGRMVFRQLAAVYARKDSGPNRGTMSQIGWLRRMWAGYRFAGGRGAVPPVNGLLPPSVTFEQGEQPAGTLPPDAEQLLTRYFHVKLESMQFFGKTNFDLPFWAGLDSLLFTFPVTLWLGRLLTTPQRGRTEAIGESLRIVDDSFGFNPLLAGKQASGVKVLAAKGELPRLIVWYGA